MLRLHPAWGLPHRHWIYPVQSETGTFAAALAQRGPQYVARSGLVVGDLLTLSESAVENAVSNDRVRLYVGIDQLVGLDDDVLREYVEEKPKTALSAYLRDECRIAPGEMSTSIIFGEPIPPTLPRELVEDFQQRAGPAIRSWIMDEVEPLARELLAAATENRKPDAHPDVVDRVESILRYGLHDGPLPLVRADDGSWVLLPRNLHERVFLELAHVYSERPRLRRCRYCGRPFIPSTAHEQRCGVGVWLAGTDTIIRACAPQAEIISDEERAQRKREQTRLLVKKSRARKKGTDSDEYRSASDEYERWRQQHPPPARKTKRKPSTTEILPPAPRQAQD